MRRNRNAHTHTHTRNLVYNYYYFFFSNRGEREREYISVMLAKEKPTGRHSRTKMFKKKNKQIVLKKKIKKFFLKIEKKLTEGTERGKSSNELFLFFKILFVSPTFVCDVITRVFFPLNLSRQNFFFPDRNEQLN